MNFDYLSYIPDSIFPWDLKILISDNNLPYSKNKYKTHELAEKDLSTPFVCSLTTENKGLEIFLLERIHFLRERPIQLQRRKMKIINFS